MLATGLLTTGFLATTLLAAIFLVTGFLITLAILTGALAATVDFLLLVFSTGFAEHAASTVAIAA